MLIAYVFTDVQRKPGQTSCSYEDSVDLLSHPSCLCYGYSHTVTISCLSVQDTPFWRRKPGYNKT